MALKIFLSSVFTEFEAARAEIKDQVHRLGDLFTGMEYFGSNPLPPVEFDAKVARSADIFVGLIGRNYGSVESQTGKSFTELEYEAAIAAEVECLIYFFGSLEDLIDDQRQAAFRSRLKSNHVAQYFADVSDLKFKFLTDFIKLLRGPLFDRVIPAERGPIPAGALRAISSEFIDQEIRIVSQGKYREKLYVNRQAETELEEFASFDTKSLPTINGIFESLRESSAAYHLEGRVRDLLQMPASQLFNPVFDQKFSNWMEKLRAAFCGDDVREDLRAISDLLSVPEGPSFQKVARQVIRRIRSRPFSVNFPSDEDAMYTLEGKRQAERL